MRAYFQRASDGEFVNENVFSAYVGFSAMGWECGSFVDFPSEGLGPEDIVVGHIGSVRRALRNVGVQVPAELDYPEELAEYLGRKVWRTTMHSVVARPESWPVFVKSVSGKLVAGFVCDGLSSLRGRGSAEDFDVWCSEPVRFVSEHRCFVVRKKLVDSRRYAGRWDVVPDYGVIGSAAAAYASAPAACSMDFGVTEDGRTLLVEVNDGYALGSYGMRPISYAKFLSARWSELTGTEDMCAF